MQIRALSVRPPWSQAITSHGKNVENRQWKFVKKYRGPLLIHASKTITERDYYEALTLMPEGVDLNAFPRFLDVERGGIVGACELYEVKPAIEQDEGWAMADCLRLMLRKQIVLPFRAYPGALGLFKVELTPAEADALRAAGLLPE